MRCKTGMLFKGGDKNFQQDREKALQWLRSSGSGGAQYQIGLIYYEAENYLEAKKWFVKANDNGNPDGLCKLGWMYYNELGVREDIQISKDYFRESIQEKSDGESYAIMAEFYYHGIGFEYPSVKLAKDFTYRAIDRKCFTSTYILGLIYEKEDWDTNRAERYFDLALDHGDYRAALGLGRIYMNAGDYEEALDYFTLALEKEGQGI